MSQPIDRTTAQAIIQALRQGTVPRDGLEHYVVGLDAERAAIASEFEQVAAGGANIKFIRGAYGAGKTFLANLTLADAQRLGFVTARCAISVQVPLSKLETLYTALMAELQVRGQHQALKGLLDRWIYSIEDTLIEEQGYAEDDFRLRDAVTIRLKHDLSSRVELPASFAQAVLAYYEATRADDFTQANGVLGWLAGQPGIGADVKRKASLSGSVDETQVPGFLRGVAAVCAASGAKGLAIAIDELETIQRLRRDQREKALNNLRQIVDDVQSQQYPYLYILGTGTEDFFEGPRGVRQLEPLYDRIQLRESGGFSNPRQTQIALRAFDRPRLVEVARKVRDLFQIANPEPALDPVRSGDAVIEAVADQMTSKLGGQIAIVPRLFLRDWVNVLDLVQLNSAYDPLAQYQPDLRPGDLNPEESEALGSDGDGFQRAPLV